MQKMVKAKVRVMERCSSLCYKESTFSSLETSLLMMSLPVMLASKSAAFLSLYKEKKVHNFLTPKAPWPLEISTRNLREVVGHDLT